MQPCLFIWLGTGTMERLGWERQNTGGTVAIANCPNYYTPINLPKYILKGNYIKHCPSMV